MSLPLAVPLLCGRRSLVGCAGAEPPQPVPLGMHGSFVRASDVGSGHPASGSHLCKGTVSPGCQHSHPAVEKGAPGFPGHPCHQLQLPARGPSPGPCPSPPSPFAAAGEGSPCVQHLRECNAISANCQPGQGRLPLRRQGIWRAFQISPP